ncbi:MAG: winged helix-turn-helix domain-containing protein [Myxococcota bacterium]
MRVLDLDSGLGPALASLGCGVVTDPPSLDVLNAVDLVAMPPNWALLREWRTAGARVPVLVAMPSAPEDLASLQPVAVVRSGDTELVRRALRSLEIGRAAGRMTLGSARVDLEARTVTRGDHSTRLTQREADLLGYLGAREREVEREELLVQVWGHVRPTSLRAVDMAVLRLRKKIEPEPAQPRFLLSSYAGGYRLVVPGPDDRVLRTFRTSIELLLQHGKPRDALAMLDEHEAVRDPADVASAVQRDTLACRAWFALGDLPRAVAVGERGLQQARTHGLEALEIPLGCALAAALRPHGHGDRARTVARRSLELAEHRSDLVGRARSLAILADLERGPRALELAQQGLEALLSTDASLREGVDLQTLHGALRTRIARGLTEAGRAPESIPHLEWGTRIFEMLGKPRMEGQLHLAIAAVHLDGRDFAAAEPPLQRGLAVLRTSESPRALAHGLLFEAMLRFASQRIDAARAALAEAHHLYGERGTARTAAADCVEAACLVALGRIDEARPWVAGIVESSGAHEPVAYFRAVLEVCCAETQPERDAARQRLAATPVLRSTVIDAFDALLPAP